MTRDQLRIKFNDSPSALPKRQCLPECTSIVDDGSFTDAMTFGQGLANYPHLAAQMLEAFDVRTQAVDLAG
jgi:hypothetical protein